MADYNGVLAELRARRKAAEDEMSSLDIAIAAIERLVPTPGGARGLAPRQDSPSGLLIPSRTFVNLTLQQAISKYLRMVKASQSTRQITEALQRGGFETRSGKPYRIVYNTLQRLSDSTGPFERDHDNMWKLRLDSAEQLPIEDGQ